MGTAACGSMLNQNKSTNPLQLVICSKKVNILKCYLSMF